MNKETVITIWITKFINCIGILLGLIFTPMQYYFCGLDFSIGNFIVLLIMSIFIVMFFLILLIKTNDPLTRFNPLSINKKYQTTMTHSIDERPNQLFEFDQPTQEEIKQLRNMNIGRIMDSKSLPRKYTI